MAYVSKRQSLDTVPDDVVLEIFSFLEADSVLALAQVRSIGFRAQIWHI